MNNLKSNAKLTKSHLKLILEIYLNQAKFDSEDFEQESARVFAAGKAEAYKHCICKHEEYAGRRVYRGLFKTASGRLVNADVNGSLNILRKCKPKAFADGVQGVVVHPRVITL